MDAGHDMKFNCTCNLNQPAGYTVKEVTEPMADMLKQIRESYNEK
jgi:hypothetical protein